METSIIAELAGQFGPAGMIIGYLVWDRLTVVKERMMFDRERLQADKEMVAALAELRAVITTTSVSSGEDG